jgi:hemolysin III
LAWLLAGGLAYTFGILFFAIDRIPFNHAIWHLFVIAGSTCHYLAVLWYVVPKQAAG